MCLYEMKEKYVIYENHFENLTEHNIMETFVQWMTKEHEDFAADYQRCMDAIATLQQELGDSVMEKTQIAESWVF